MLLPDMVVEKDFIFAAFFSNETDYYEFAIQELCIPSNDVAGDDVERLPIKCVPVGMAVLLHEYLVLQRTTVITDNWGTV